MIKSLVGIRVVDLSWVWAGPASTRILADLGADVVKIEAPHRPDSVRALVQDRNESHPDYWDHGGYFIEKNLGKRGMTLNLSTIEGKEVFLRLVSRAHVLVESFSPRVMEQLGLSFEQMREVRPNLIMVSLSGYGATGRHRDRTAYGAALEAESGITSTIGYDGGPPVKSGLAYTDPLSGVLAAGAILHALYRQESGELESGTHIDLAEREVALPFISEQIGIFQLDHEPPARIGNRHDDYVPQGCYPCTGTDRWVTITIRSDAEWTRLARLMGRSELADCSHEDRSARASELNESIAAFCRDRTDRQVVALLQAEGIPAAEVQDGRDLLRDPQLRSRDFFTDVRDQLVGTKPFFRFLGAKFEKTLCQPAGPAPRLDEHTEGVLSELGYDSGAVREMKEAGVWGHVLTRESRTNLGLPLQLLQNIGAVTEIDDLPGEEQSRSQGLKARRPRVNSVEEFIAVALEHFEIADRTSARFLSGETFPRALARWWAETVELKVTSGDVFEWTCPGCHSRVAAAGVPLYTLPMFDYVLWEFCPSCREPNG